LDSKIKEWQQKLKNPDKRLKLFVAIGIVGILLILLSEMLPASSGSKNAVKEAYSYEEYTALLEEKTEDIIGAMEGVGACKVMITLKDTKESIYAKNGNENKSDSSYSKTYEYVLYDGDGGETPVLIKEYFPEIKGVVVVCTGADNTFVRENVINSIMSLYNLPASKISVSKMK